MVYVDSDMASARTKRPRDELPEYAQSTKKPRKDSATAEAGKSQLAHESLKSVEKDETEERLEKLLFGDEDGFLNSIRNYGNADELALGTASGQDVGLVADETEDFDGVTDENLFFLDTGSAVPSKDVAELEDADSGDEDKYKAAWLDSDDDRLQISLATNSRLRKLRDFEGEDIISGREYIKRLRRQYERLHPRPNWAKPQSLQRGDKRNRRHSGSASDSEVSGNDGDLVSDVKPLAELLRSAGLLTQIAPQNCDSRKRRKFRPEVIDIQRTKDVTGHGPSAVDCLQFHPFHPLLLSGGPASTVYLHHISPHPPNPNPLLTSLHLKGTPLRTAAFLPAPIEDAKASGQPDTKIFLSSRRRYMHTWSLGSGVVQKLTRPIYGNIKARNQQRTMEHFKLSLCGRYIGLIGSGRKGGGVVNVLSANTMQWLTSCRIDSVGGVADFDWWQEGNGISIVGKNGEVSEYDVDAQKVVARWVDEGAVGTTVIALGGEIDGKAKQVGRSRWVAIGSSSGIVNLYDRMAWGREVTSTEGEAMPPIPRNPKPLRTFDHLTTPTSNLVFSQDGQMLVMASRWKKDALRAIHLPSATVYRNWPTDKTPFGRISSVALSLDGGLLAVGNEQGKIRLWEIRE